MTAKNREPLQLVSEKYVLAYQAAKAAANAYAAGKSHHLFELLVESIEDFASARLRLLGCLSHYPGAKPPEPPTDT